jgi:hypothetical protein
VTTVALQSTGVYWIPVYEILEARGLEELSLASERPMIIPMTITGALSRARSSPGIPFQIRPKPVILVGI